MTIFYAPDLERLIIYPFKKRVAGIEPAREGDSTPANKRVSVYSPKALIKILTNLTDEDRRMLARIVERWGSLSDELKRAVLG